MSQNPNCSSVVVLGFLCLEGDDGQWGSGFPSSSGEVGAFDRGRAIGDGFFGEGDDRGDGHAVVGVHIDGFSFAKALDEAEVFDEVHAAVAGAGGLFAEGGQQRVFEFFMVFGEVFPGVGAGAFFEVNFFFGVFADQAFGALEEDLAAVGARGVGVVGDEDGWAAGGFDEGVDDVAESVFDFGQFVVGAVAANRFFVKAEGRAGHGDEIFEFVAAGDVHPLGDRSEAVTGVEIGVAFDGVLEAPVVGIVGLAEFVAAEVVKVAALGVEQIAEHFLADEVENQQFGFVVAAIFHGAAVFFIFFGIFDDLPALIEGDGAGDFGGGVGAGLHGVGGHRDVEFPGGGGIDQIEFFGVAHAFEVVDAVVVLDGRGHIGIFKLVLGPVEAFGADVADGFHFDAFDFEQVAKMAAALVADADEADFYGIQRRGGEMIERGRSG